MQLITVTARESPQPQRTQPVLLKWRQKCVVSVSNQWCRTLLEHSAPTPSLPRQQQVRCRTALYPTNLPTRLQTSKGSRQQNSRRSSLTSLLHLPVPKPTTKRPASGRSRSLWHTTPSPAYTTDHTAAVRPTGCPWTRIHTDHPDSTADTILNSTAHHLQTGIPGKQIRYAHDYVLRGERTARTYLGELSLTKWVRVGYNPDNPRLKKLPRKLSPTYFTISHKWRTSR